MYAHAYQTRKTVVTAENPTRPQILICDIQITTILASTDYVQISYHSKSKLGEHWTRKNFSKMAKEGGLSLAKCTYMYHYPTFLANPLTYCYHDYSVFLATENLKVCLLGI